MGILEVKKEIRRALSIPLNTAAQAASIPVQWPDLPFDRTGKPAFVAVGIDYGAVEVMEIGPTPRFSADGVLTLNVRSIPQMGADENDRIMKIIAQAYPYGTTLSFDGVNVHVDKSMPGGYAMDGPWLSGIGTIYWTVYRRD